MDFLSHTLFSLLPEALSAPVARVRRRGPTGVLPLAAVGRSCTGVASCGRGRGHGLSASWSGIRRISSLVSPVAPSPLLGAGPSRRLLRWRVGRFRASYLRPAVLGHSLVSKDDVLAIGTAGSLTGFGLTRCRPALPVRRGGGALPSGSRSGGWCASGCDKRGPEREPGPA